MKKEETLSLSDTNVKVPQNVSPVKAIGTPKNNAHNVIGNDLSKNTIMILSDTLADYRRSSKNLVKTYADKYLRKNITNRDLLSFMLGAIERENVNFEYAESDFVSEYNEDVEVVDTTDGYMTKIRQDNRWFYDLMLYLNDKYTERQLLNSEFFKTVKDKYLLKTFSKNADIIDKLSGSIQSEYKQYKTKIADGAQKEFQPKQK